MALEDELSDAGRARFVTTAWTVVLTAAQDGSPGADDALARLCQAYWKPIYAFVLHRRYSTHDAEDLTQEFFTELIADRTLARADRERGRFRSFLLGALRRFLAGQSERRGALKRGGACETVSLNTLVDVEWPVTLDDGAEKQFEARWARTVLDAALAQLRTEWNESGQSARFETMRQFLPGAGNAPPSYEAAAAQLDLSESALKSLIHRLRSRYRNVLRQQVARTVGAPHEVDDEIRHLCAAVASLGEEPAVASLRSAADA